MTTPKSQADQGAAGQESPPRDQIGASPEAISAHYDVGEEFFQLWLGPELVYSCAMFDGTDAGARVALEADAFEQSPQIGSVR